MREQHQNVHPAHEFLEKAAGQSESLGDLEAQYPALWAHLQECEECLAAFTQLIQASYDQGHRASEAQAAQTHRSLRLISAVSIAAVVVLVGGFSFWQARTGENVIEGVYRNVSPAVADIQVQSAGVTGAGVLFDKRGYVLTNLHVIKDATGDQDIVVQFSDTSQLTPQIIGYDIATDLAVLKVYVPSNHHAVAKIGDSSKVEVGDVAIVIGNPFGLSDSLSVGHISAVGRQFMTNDPYAPDVPGVLQTDAAINPGNSGGPLLNESGQVVGITSRIESPSGGSVGLGFAIPSNLALEVARQIISQGYVTRPFFGVGGVAVDATLAQELGLSVDHGVLVQQIYPGSPAEQIGLSAGGDPVQTSQGMLKKGADIIVSVDGQAVNTEEELNAQVAGYAVGDTVQVAIVRNGQPMTLQATLVQRPRALDVGGAATPAGADFRFVIVHAGSDVIMKREGERL